MNVVTRNGNLFDKSRRHRRDKRTYVGVAVDIYSGSSCPEIFQNLSITLR